ncbi:MULTISPECIES: PqiC family protein [unclassified Paracoccus (in: a-proteobacteria)]|uniref:PqiC family protein n=1 Tax=unclassified Paracoccus (in: a-proteobacteria) TaxID=2688777 RepID=UPI0012B2520F|nr:MULTISPECIES: PqiC family protein [unclassified Paracoccus (in: a-proteobacteria)]UXU75849.1 PqiC family protein [Paracoccus sp. SMMA_5]UXU81758.1 PqiC family protein [Paracoccus sp. SMMA_5_TC]
MRLILAAAAGLALLGACSNGEKTARYLIDPPSSGERLADRLGTAELKDVSLPEYAAGDEVSWQTADGAVRSNTKQLWADSPQRAFTLTLARSISEISGATVIAEPWPLAEPPRRRLEVRVEKALAQADGLYRLSGRYFVSDEGAGGSNQARSFDIAVPLQGQGPGPIARAQSQAIAQLARQIATLSGPGRTIRTSAAPAPRIDDIFSQPLPPLEGS